MTEILDRQKYFKNYYDTHKEKIKFMMKNTIEKRRNNVEEFLKKLNGNHFKRLPLKRMMLHNIIKNDDGQYIQKQIDEDEEKKK
jgi:hypothetical protein